MSAVPDIQTEPHTGTVWGVKSGRPPMPIAGEIIRESTRRAALGAIDDVLGHAGSSARIAGNDALASHARAPFDLLDLSPRQLSRFTERFERSLVWTDEGNCFNRAMFGAHLLDRHVGLGATPIDDVFAGAIAVSAHQHLDGGYNGGFHAALAVRVRGTEELQVLDLLPHAPRLQPLSTWSRNPEPLVLRPWAGTGLWDGVSSRSTWVGEKYFDFARSQLRSTWNAAESYGVRVWRSPAET